MRLLRFYAASLRKDLLIHFQYRASLGIWLLSLIMEPLVYLLVWQAVARAQGGAAGAYTPGRFAAYFMLMMVVNHATFTWIMYYMSYQIRSGRLAGRLLYPLHPIHGDASNNAAYKVLALLVLIPAFGAMAAAFRPEFHFAAWHAPAFLLALGLAALTRFLLEWTLALAGFWIVDTGALNLSYMTLLMLFSGRMAPMDLFPEWFATAGRILPFWWCLAFPVEILMGGLMPTDVALGCLALAAWGLAAGGLLTVIWKAGVRRFGAVGL